VSESAGVDVPEPADVIAPADPCAAGGAVKAPESCADAGAIKAPDACAAAGTGVVEAAPPPCAPLETNTHSEYFVFPSKLWSARLNPLCFNGSASDKLNTPVMEFPSGFTNPHSARPVIGSR